VRPNPDPCDYFDGSSADGAGRFFLVNADPCDYFDGSSADGAGRGVFVNPDTCGYFEGGLADGQGRTTLISPVSCTAFFSSQRDGATRVFASCLTLVPLTVQASELYGRTEGPDGYLWWYTFSETNNLGFILQRSTDQLTWTEIGFAPGLSSSNTRQKYEDWDRDMQVGVTYYRWQQIDLVGTTTYSNIVALVKTMREEASLVVYPNPVGASEVLHVHFQTDLPSPLRVTIVDAVGHLVLVQDYPEMPSPVELSYETASLAAGIYFVNVQTATGRYARRFMVR
jgi:hypothetical protein